MQSVVKVIPIFVCYFNSRIFRTKLSDLLCCFQAVFLICINCPESRWCLIFFEPQNFTKFTCLIQLRTVLLMWSVCLLFLPLFMMKYWQFISLWFVCTLCPQKNDTDVAHYNFDTDQPILIRDVAERVCYQKVICYPTSPDWCICTTWENMNPGNCVHHLFVLDQVLG